MAKANISTLARVGRELPFEVLDAIVNLAETKADMASCALASKALCEIAQRAMYRRLQFVLPTMTVKCCQSMLRKPILGSYVRLLEVAVMTRALEHKDGTLTSRCYEPFESAIWRILSEALELMTGLKRHLLVAQWHGAMEILVDRPFRLKTLHINTVDQLPIKLLRQQDAIKELIFWSTAEPSDATLRAIKAQSRELLASAEHIGGRYQLLCPLLSGHVLRGCDFLIGPPVSSEKLSELLQRTGKASPKLTYVHLCLKTLAQLDLVTLSESFPYTEVIYIHIYGGDMLDCFFLEWMQRDGTMEAFGKFKALKTILLSHAQFTQFHDPDQFQAALDALAIACPTLQSLSALAAHIDYMRSTRTIIKDSYWRIRDGEAPPSKLKNGELMRGANLGEVWMIDHVVTVNPISPAWSAAYPLELTENCVWDVNIVSGR